MRIDSHLHIWRAMPDQPHPPGTAMSPTSDVPLALYAEYMAEHAIDRAVFVQPMYPGEDNSYVADCAAAQPDRLAAVCVVDPRQPGAADRLEYWVKERGCRGLRLRPRFGPEAAVFGHPSTYPLWEKAQALGVVITLLMAPAHIAPLAALADRFPQTALVIDHLGHPDVAAGVNGAGFQALLDLARFPNVHVKLSGFYHFTRQPYPYTDCWDLVRALYDRFGPTRLLWGSDFPHVILHTDFGRTVQLLARTYPFLSQADLALIMGGTAARLYWPA